MAAGCEGVTGGGGGGGDGGGDGGEGGEGVCAVGASVSDDGFTGYSKIHTLMKSTHTIIIYTLYQVYRVSYIITDLLWRHLLEVGSR